MDAREFDQGVRDLKAALDQAGSDAASAGQKLADALDSASKKGGDALKTLASRAVSTGKTLSLAVTAPLLLIGKKAADIAATYEQNMNILQATTGATGAQMKELGALATALGADMNLPATSAADAAKAMQELAKGGLGIKDAMDAARPTLQLSAAAQIDNARAAEIVSDALNQFGLQGNQAGRVADLLAAASISAGGGIEKMSLGLRQAAPVFSSLGLNINEATTAVALMAKAGHKGEEGGTALKTAFIQLSKPTTEAAKLMQKLGFQIFDAHGKTKPFREIVVDLSTKIGKLTEQQRAQVTATLGGSHAFQSLTVLAHAGADGYDRMAASVNKQGQAAALAGAQNKGLKGALDAMQSAFETAANAGIQPIIGDLTHFAKSIGELVNKFSELPEGTRRFIVEALAAAAALGPLLIGIGKVMGAVTALKGTILAARAAGGIAAWLASGPVLIAVGAILAAIALLAVAWTQDWGHIREVTFDVMNSIISSVEIFGHGLAQIFEGITDVLAGEWADGWGKIKAGTDNALNAMSKGVAAARAERQRMENEANAGAKALMGAKGVAHANWDQIAKDSFAQADAKRAAAPVNAPRPAGIFHPGLIDTKTPKGKKSPLQMEQEQFAKERAEISIKLAAALRGESKAQQDLLAQFPHISKGQRDALIGDKLALDKKNEVIDSQKRYREETARVEETVRALKDGTSTEMADLGKSYKGVSQAQLEYLNNQNQTRKALELARQKAKELADQMRSARAGLLETATGNKVAAAATKLFGEELLKTHPDIKTAEELLTLLTPAQQKAAEEFAELGRKVKVSTQMTEARKSIDEMAKSLLAMGSATMEDRLAVNLFSESIKANGVAPLAQLSEEQQKVVRRTRELTDDVFKMGAAFSAADEQHNALLTTEATAKSQLEDLQRSVLLSKGGTEQATFAWEKFHVILEQLPKDTQLVVAEMLRLEKSVKIDDLFKQARASLLDASAATKEETAAVQLFGEEMLKSHPTIKTATELFAALTPEQQQSAAAMADWVRQTEKAGTAADILKQLDEARKQAALVAGIAGNNLGAPIGNADQIDAATRFKVPIDQLTAAMLAQSQELTRLNTVVDDGSKVLEFYKQRSEAIRGSFGQTRVSLIQAKDQWDAVTHGTDVSRKALEMFGVPLSALPQKTRDALKELVQVTKLTDAFTQVKDGFLNIFEGAFKELKGGFGGFFKSIMQGFDELLIGIATKFLASKLTDLLFSLVPGGTGFLSKVTAGGLSGKAVGGPVSMGESYLVGERGPEMFVPSRSGRIVPNHQLAGAGGGGGNIYLTQNISVQDATGLHKAQSQIRADAAQLLAHARKRNLT
jgi:TP901 family phage tail tape measure protein